MHFLVEDGSEEDKAPVPTQQPSSSAGDTVDQLFVLPGPHAGEDTADSADDTASAVDSVEEDDVPDILADTTDLLNVDGAGGRDVNYDVLDSGDEAAKDDVVTDTESNAGEWPSHVSAGGEIPSGPGPRRDGY
ncbi:hypothetical protein V7S43_007734 [Phytophthora oleae]|uniref:Uncharacterized protein n=1 Tax=Phytophthora oleae TaxID=2107226 RepID=A0ABD3FMG1_9STRA